MPPLADHWPSFGKPHTVYLSYLPDGDSIAVVGSVGGADPHPAWYHNLRAIPEVTIQDGGRVLCRLSRAATRPRRDRR